MITMHHKPTVPDLFDRVRLWAYRLQYFGLRDLAIVLSQNPSTIEACLAPLEAETVIVRHDSDLWAWIGKPLEVITKRMPSDAEIVARTIDKIRQITDALEAHNGGALAARRWALRALNQLLIRGGWIESLHSNPRASRYREKARKLQERLILLGQQRDGLAVLLSGIGFVPGGAPPLPDRREDLWHSSAYRILEPRFGFIGQMLAGSKSRAPWSPRCVFNARISFEDRQDQPIWKGDTWLLPPTQPYESRRGRDPRAGAIELAQTYMVPVMLSYEFGPPIWIATPDGTIEPTNEGIRAAIAAGHFMERAGWPGYNDWADLPVEHRVSKKGEPESAWEIRSVTMCQGLESDS